MTCEDWKPYFADYWSQDLPPAERARFEAHLAECGDCRVQLQNLGGLWDQLALLPREEPGPQVSRRFQETLEAYRNGLESAPRGRFWDRIAALWPRRPAMQMGLSFALLALGIGLGYGLRPESAGTAAQLAQLRGEVSGMRQLVALSLLQQQSASERLRGVSWAVRVEPSDTEVLSALLQAVNNDPNVNVRLAAVDALQPFAANPVVKGAVVKALTRQAEPLVQIALIDLLVDLREKTAAPALQEVAMDTAADAGVRQRAQWALEKLQ